MIIKWETIKKKAINELWSRQTHYPFISDAQFMALLPAIVHKEDPRSLAKKWMIEAEKLIKAWDIRMAGKLIELFPLSFPKNKKLLGIDQDEKDNWILITSGGCKHDKRQNF